MIQVHHRRTNSVKFKNLWSNQGLHTADIVRQAHQHNPKCGTDFVDAAQFGAVHFDFDAREDELETRAFAWFGFVVGDLCGG